MAELALLEQSLLTDLPIIIRYIEQKLEPTAAKELHAKIINALANTSPDGETVTDVELFEASKGVVDGIVSVIPDGKAKDITTAVLDFGYEVAGKITGENHATIIKLVIDGIGLVKEIQADLKK
jgi:hypothetical protein